MVEVTCQNFRENLSTIDKDLVEASFTCLDFEFTGLHTNRCPKISLFDTPQERYNILRESCRDFTVLQCGLSIFKYDKISRIYHCNTYNFCIFPRPFKSLNRQTHFDTSACEFLMKFDFDFNKCFYGGIPYLNENEIAALNSPNKSSYVQEIVLNNVKLEFIKRKLASIEKWCVESRLGEVDQIDCFSRGTTELLKHNIMEQFGDVIAESLPDETSLLQIRKTTKKDKVNYLQELEQLAEEKLKDAIGFTHVFRLLRKYKRPLVGHNILMDVMFVYEKFYAPLPESYEEFKCTVVKEFPVIYDTRHIISNMKVELRTDKQYKDFFRGTSLLCLFEECEQKHVRGMLYQPIIQDNLSEGSGMKEHDAGYDSCLVGHVFLRLAHFYTLRKYNSPNIKPFHFQDYLREFNKFKHCLNLIRCSLTHINLMEQDPEFKRPQWLLVKLRDRSHTINEDHVSCVFSAFGDVSVRKVSDGSCLVAMPSVNMAAGLLVEMKNNKRYVVKRHQPTREYCWNVLVISLASLGIISGFLFLGNKVIRR